MTTEMRTRSEIKAEILELEQKLKELRAELPSPFFTVYRFTSLNPRSKVYTYAETETQGREKALQKVRNDYGSKAEIHGSVVTFDPHTGSSDVYGNLFQNLTPEDALLLSKDVEVYLSENPLPPRQTIPLLIKSYQDYSGKR